MNRASAPAEQPKSRVGSLAGSGVVAGDLVAPVAAAAGWEADERLLKSKPVRTLRNSLRSRSFPSFP